jgi:hypothetical protein
MIDIQPNDIGIPEPPSISNGWSRLTIRSRKARTAVVTIHWRVV